MGYNRYNAPPLLSRYVVDDNDCWIYQGEIGRHGYGVVTIGQRRDGDRRRVQAHRYFYESLRSAIPDGLFCCHKCDVRACVNPDHIFLGTQQDNISDMMAKGRNGLTGAKGERNGFAKIDAETAKLVKIAHGTNKDVAERFGITPSSAQAIRSGRNWRHI